MATIKEVAEHAQVSVATVSRVVNNSGYVSDDLRDRVHEAMQTLNYKPSALARSLRRQETLTVGLLMPQINQPFFSTLAFAVEKTLFDNEYRTLICSSEENDARETAYVEMLLRQRVDGVIIVPTGRTDENIMRLLDLRVPVVLIDRDIPNVPINRVLSDNRGGAYKAVMHLLKLGHRRIALIGGPPYSETMIQRAEGAYQAYAEMGITYDSDLIIMGTMSQFELGYKTARTLLQLTKPPTAIFALNDVVAVGVMHAAAELGLRLPADLSVVGYDDIPLAGYVIPELTTVEQPIYRMGEYAVQILLRRLKNHAAPLESVTLDTRLIVRKSTAAPMREVR